MATTATKQPKKKERNIRTPPANRTVGGYLLDRLQQNGVQHIFGIPGDYVLRFDKMIEGHAIQFINATRENTAGFMADAYARMRGLGVACITYGVGINITNAISQAYVESSPVVIISGAPGTNEFEQSHYLHHLINQSFGRDLTQLEIFKQITVDQAVLTDANTAPFEIDRVLESCLLKKKPVYIELPRNIVEAPISIHHPPPPSELISDPEVLQEAVKEVAAILQASRSPVLWIGHEIERYGLSSALLKFAEKFHIPIVSTLLGKSAISEHHPLFVGVYQGDLSRPEVSRFVNSCDCILVFGTVQSDVDTGAFTAKLDHELRVIASASELIVRHHHYHDIAFPEFIQALSDLKGKTRYKTDYPANINRKQAVFSPERHKIITATRMFDCIQKHLKPEHIVVTDFGDCLMGSVDLTIEQDSFLACAYFGTLGFGVPGAIGAQFAAPKRRVIGIVGDGAFQMTCTELSTAVRYHLDPVIIVMNNHGYGTERPLLEGAYNDILNWNYTELTRVFGSGIGIRTTTEDQFEKALIQALERRGEFTLIEVELGKLDFSPTMQRFLKIMNKHVK